MRRWKTWFACVLCVVGVGAVGAFAQERVRARTHRARAFVRELAFSREQKEQALAVARQAAPLVRELREEVMRERARLGGDRQALRERARTARETAFRALEPRVRALVATLTPEQRARLEALAERHGRTFDETRFTRRLARLLARPGAAPRLERHLSR